eukprot:TRINITY_DN60774_c0_g1_i1.p1 TRINITY_DN60774_c0_g1~~TRINITY_DN60774_c0_g1_i1.p1  ORF type:complete len:1161 (+),score=260.55 TRINITY_DN60774_c0_g1_i1:73-3483(+)
MPGSNVSSRPSPLDGLLPAALSAHSSSDQQTPTSRTLTEPAGPENMSSIWLSPALVGTPPDGEQFAAEEDQTGFPTLCGVYDEDFAWQTAVKKLREPAAESQWPSVSDALLPTRPEPTGVLVGEEGAAEALQVVQEGQPLGWFSPRRDASEEMPLPPRTPLARDGILKDDPELSACYTGEDGDSVEFRCEGGAMHYVQGGHRSPVFRSLLWTVKGAEGAQAGSLVMRDIGRRITVALRRPVLADFLSRLRTLSDIANVEHNLGVSVGVRPEKRTVLREICVGYNAVSPAAHSVIQWYPVSDEPLRPGRRRYLRPATDSSAITAASVRTADQWYILHGVPLLESSATLFVVPDESLHVYLRGLGQRHPQLSFCKYEPPPQSSIGQRSVEAFVAAPATLAHPSPEPGTMSDVDEAASVIGLVRVVLTTHTGLRREVDAAREAVEQLRTPLGQLASPLLRLRWWRVIVDLRDPSGFPSRAGRHALEISRFATAMHRWQVNAQGQRMLPVSLQATGMATQGVRAREYHHYFRAATWTLNEAEARERGRVGALERGTRAAVIAATRARAASVNQILEERRNFEWIAVWRWRRPDSKSPSSRRWLQMLKWSESRKVDRPTCWDGRFQCVADAELLRWRQGRLVVRGRAALRQVEAEEWKTLKRRAAEAMFMITGVNREAFSRQLLAREAVQIAEHLRFVARILGEALDYRRPTERDETARWRRLLRAERNNRGRFELCSEERVARRAQAAERDLALERARQEACEDQERVANGFAERTHRAELAWLLCRCERRWAQECAALAVLKDTAVAAQEAGDRLLLEACNSAERCAISAAQLDTRREADAAWRLQTIAIGAEEHRGAAVAVCAALAGQHQLLVQSAALQAAEASLREQCAAQDAVHRAELAQRRIGEAERVRALAQMAERLAAQIEKLRAQQRAWEEFVLRTMQEFAKEHAWRHGHTAEQEAIDREKMEQWFYATLDAMGRQNGSVGYRPGRRWRACPERPRPVSATLGRAGVRAQQKLDALCSLQPRRRQLAASEHMLRRRQWEAAAALWADTDLPQRQRPQTALGGRPPAPTSGPLSPWRGAGPHMPRRLLPAMDLCQRQRPRTALGGRPPTADPRERPASAGAATRRTVAPSFAI